MASIFGFISNLIGESISGILHLLSSPFVLLYNLVCWILTKLMEAIGSIGHLVTLPFIFLYNLVCVLGVKLKEAISYTGELLLSPFNFLYNFAISIWGKLKECPSVIINAMAGLWNKMINGVGNLLSSPFVWLHNLVSFIWEKVKESMGMIKNEIASIWEFLIEKMEKPVNYIGDFMSCIWVKMRGCSLGVWDFISDGISSIGEFMSSIWGGVIKMVSSMGDGMTAVVIYPVDKIKQHPYVFGFVVLVVVLLLLCWYCPDLFCWSTTIVPGVIMVVAGSAGVVWIIKVVIEAIIGALGEFFSYIWVNVKNALGDIWVNVKNSYVMIEIVTIVEDGANGIALSVKMAVDFAGDEMKQHPYLLCEFIFFLVVILALRWCKPTLFSRFWRATTTPAGLPVKTRATSKVTQPLLG